MAHDRVLLVDDRPTNLMALKALLEPLGCDLVLAETGEEALQRLLEDDVAVILLDVQLPGMDGFEVAELIKRRERTRHIPLIFLTATAGTQTAIRGYSAGAADFVSTPFDPDLLRSKVHAFLELARAHAQARRQADELSAMLAEREASVARLQRMVDGLLMSTLAGPDAPIEEVALGEVVAEVLLSLEPMVAERDAVVEVEPLPVVACNRVHLLHIMRNLVSNGVKFVPPGRRPTVHVTAAPRGDRWVVAVSDNGMGVSEEERDRILDVSASRVAEPPEGIGLAVCARMVERHGGRLDVRPGPEGGSVFTFDVPAASPSQAGPVPRASRHGERR